MHAARSLLHPRLRWGRVLRGVAGLRAMQAEAAAEPATEVARVVPAEAASDEMMRLLLELRLAEHLSFEVLAVPEMGLGGAHLALIPNVTVFGNPCSQTLTFRSHLLALFLIRGTHAPFSACEPTL